jgi:hypothetical protein
VPVLKTDWSGILSAATWGWFCSQRPFLPFPNYQAPILSNRRAHTVRAARAIVRRI